MWRVDCEQRWLLFGLALVMAATCRRASTTSAGFICPRSKASCEAVDSSLVRAVNCYELVLTLRNGPPHRKFGLWCLKLVSIRVVVGHDARAWRKDEGNRLPSPLRLPATWARDETEEGSAAAFIRKAKVGFHLSLAPTEVSKTPYGKGTCAGVYTVQVWTATAPWTL